MLKTNERKDKDLLHLLALIFIHLNFTYSRYSFFLRVVWSLSTIYFYLRVHTYDVNFSTKHVLMLTDIQCILLIISPFKMDFKSVN